MNDLTNPSNTKHVTVEQAFEITLFMFKQNQKDLEKYKEAYWVTREACEFYNSKENRQMILDTSDSWVDVGGKNAELAISKSDEILKETICEQEKGKTKKYRSKPVTVEAMEYTGRNMILIETWSNGYASASDKGDGSFMCDTLEGYMTISKGDFVIKGTHGEYYPCKPDVFKFKYEPIEEYDRLT